MFSLGARSQVRPIACAARPSLDALEPIKGERHPLNSGATALVSCPLGLEKLDGYVSLLAGVSVSCARGGRSGIRAATYLHSMGPYPVFASAP